MSDLNQTPTLPLRENYSVGATVLTGLGIASNPFTDKSLDKFTSNYKNKILKSDPKTEGKFTMECTLAQTSDSRLQAIGASGKLSLTYGPISGDASLNFAMNNGQSSMDVSIVIKGDQAHRLYQSQVEDYNKLKLRDSAVKVLKRGWDEFSKTYGAYLIIGEVKGGNITYQQIYSTISKTDTLNAGGQLSLAYGKVGFEVKGSVSGDFKNTTMSTSTTLTTKSEMNPSFTDNKFDELIKTLGELANPSTIDNTNKSDDKNKDNNENKENDNDRTIASKIHDQMQNILSGDRLNITDVIVVPLDKVTCIVDQIQGDRPSKSVKTFLEYSNQLYMQFVSMAEDLKVITEHWKLDDNNKDIKNTISLYTEKTDTLKELMGYVKDSQLVGLAKARQKFLESDDTKENDKKEINVEPKTWYHIKISKLKEEFQNDILNPYNNHTKNGGKDIFQGKWALKSISSNAYLDGREQNVKVTFGNPPKDTFLLWTFEKVEENTIALRTSTNSYLDGLASVPENKFEQVVTTNNSVPKDNKQLQWTIEEINGNKCLKSISSNSYLDGRSDNGSVAYVSNRKPSNDDKFLQWTFEGPF